MQKFSETQLRFELEGFDEVVDDATERAISPEAARQISEAARAALRERMPLTVEGEDQPWLGDYVRLIEQGWPWRVACYIAWASSPKQGRWPENLGELATLLDLRSPRVIYTWRRKYPAIDTTIAMMQAAPLWEHRRDVLEALVASAVSPDYKSFNDRKLFLEMTGDYTPKSKLELHKSGKMNSLEEKSDDELRAMAGEDEPADGSEEIEDGIDFSG